MTIVDDMTIEDQRKDLVSLLDPMTPLFGSPKSLERRVGDLLSAEDVRTRIAETNGAKEKMQEKIEKMWRVQELTGEIAGLLGQAVSVEGAVGVIEDKEQKEEARERLRMLERRIVDLMERVEEAWREIEPIEGPVKVEGSDEEQGQESANMSGSPRW